MPQTNPHELKIIGFLCLIAAIHVLIFSAAFPFFNNVDEPIHFDLVLRYSNCELPDGLQRILPESVEYIAFFNSPAYYAAPAEFPGGQLPPPPWTETPDKKRQDFEANCARWQFVENYEVSQTPLYYAVAGVWWDIGKWLSIHGGRRLYWLRFFNVIPAVALVWLGYVAARMIFPDKPFIRLAVPTFTAFMPQSAFYSIGNDVLPALCFGASFICLLKWLSAENMSVKMGAASGLALAATYLTKATTLPLIIVAAGFVLLRMGQLVRKAKLNVFQPSVIAFAGCAALPIASWMIWSKSHFGDFTGARFKMEHFGWTLKPIDDWWHHPIFTPAGFWTYLCGQLSTLWQGEFQWHQEPLILSGSNFVYAAVSLVLLAASSLALHPKSSVATSLQREALGLSIICFASEMFFFAFMSVVYDFHDCPYPSRHYPYFTSGRLLLGALIPFLLVIVYGLDRILNRFGTMTKFITLAIIISLVVAGEITTDSQAFFDPYNWFHLPQQSI